MEIYFRAHFPQKPESHSSVLTYIIKSNTASESVVASEVCQWKRRRRSIDVLQLLMNFPNLLHDYACLLSSLNLPFTWLLNVQFISEERIRIECFVNRTTARIFT